MTPPDECADCGASFASPGDLVRHVAEVHHGGDARASLEMNPETRRPGLLCALCGARFATPMALARHNLIPHARPDPDPRRVPASG